MPPPTRRSFQAADGPTARPDLEWVLAGRALYRERLQSVEIGIDRSGMIAAIGKDLRAPRRHDVGEQLLMPSATDLHVHLRDPGPSSDIESFAAGTIEAAVGGVGLVADMPNTDPPVTSVERLESKERRARDRCAVDLLLYALADPQVAVEALGLRAGAFKLYLSPTSGIDEPPPATELPKLLERIAGTGLALTVHAEDPRRFDADRPAEDLVGWDRARPALAESSAVDAVLRAAPPGLRLHIAHVTEASIARRIQAAGHSFEVTPHHLLLSRNVEPPARAKVNPPLRSEADRVELWDAFCREDAGCLASDHAPHPANSKDLPFATAPSGVPGLETMLPLMLQWVRSGELPLARLLRAACERPARWLGQPRGQIAVGNRADLLVVDFRWRRGITARGLHAPCGWSPYEGWDAIFPREHYRRGERIVQDGEYVGTPRGELLRPDYAGGKSPTDR